MGDFGLYGMVQESFQESNDYGAGRGFGVDDSGDDADSSVTADADEDEGEVDADSSVAADADVVADDADSSVTADAEVVADADADADADEALPAFLMQTNDESGWLDKVMATNGDRDKLCALADGLNVTERVKNLSKDRIKTIATNTARMHSLAHIFTKERDPLLTISIKAMQQLSQFRGGTSRARRKNEETSVEEWKELYATYIVTDLHRGLQVTVKFNKRGEVIFEIDENDVVRTLLCLSTYTQEESQKRFQTTHSRDVQDAKGKTTSSLQTRVYAHSCFHVYGLFFGNNPLQKWHINRFLCRSDELTHLEAADPPPGETLRAQFMVKEGVFGSPKSYQTAINALRLDRPSSLVRANTMKELLVILDIFLQIRKDMMKALNEVNKWYRISGGHVPRVEYLFAHKGAEELTGMSAQSKGEVAVALMTILLSLDRRPEGPQNIVPKYALVHQLHFCLFGKKAGDETVNDPGVFTPSQIAARMITRQRGTTVHDSGGDDNDSNDDEDVASVGNRGTPIRRRTTVRKRAASSSRRRNRGSTDDAEEVEEVVRDGSGSGVVFEERTDAAWDGGRASPAAVMRGSSAQFGSFAHRDSRVDNSDNIVESEDEHVSVEGIEWTSGGSSSSRKKRSRSRKSKTMSVGSHGADGGNDFKDTMMLLMEGTIKENARKSRREDREELSHNVERIKVLIEETGNSIKDLEAVLAADGEDDDDDDDEATREHKERLAYQQSKLRALKKRLEQYDDDEIRGLLL